jgi:hypothetical protein
MRISHSRKKLTRFNDFLSFAILTLVSLFVFWPWLFTGKSFYWGDIGLYFAPHIDFLRNNLLSGRIPLWNPELLCGEPYAGNPQASPFYPLTILLPFFEAHRFIMVCDTLSILAGGCFFYCFLTRSRLRLHMVGAIFGAIVYMLGGYFVSKAQFPNMLAALSIAPLCLLQAQRLAKKPSMGAAVSLGIVFGVQLLAAHAQIALMTAYFSFLLMVFEFSAGRLFTPRRLSQRKISRSSIFYRFIGRFIKRAVRSAGWVVFSGALAAAIDGAQILPVAQLISHATRENLSLGYANRFFLGLNQWTNFFAPYRFNTPLNGHFDIGNRNLAHVKNFWEIACYIGIIPTLFFLMAPFQLWRSRRLSQYLFWLVVFFVSLWMSFGVDGALYSLAFRALPGIKLFHDPARFLMGSAIAAAVIGGIIMDRLARIARFSTVALAIAILAPVATVIDLGRFDMNIYPTKSIAEINSAQYQSRLISSLKADPQLRSRMGRVFMVDSEGPWSYFTSYQNYHADIPSFMAQWIDTCAPNLLMGTQIMEANAYEPVADAASMQRAFRTRDSIKRGNSEFADLAGRMAVEQVVAYRTRPLPPQAALQRLKMFQPKDKRPNIYYYRNLSFQPRARFVTADGTMLAPVLFGSAQIDRETSDMLSVSVPSSPVSRTLLVADSYYPGWEASMNGHPLSLSRTKEGFRKVIIPPVSDSSNVVFNYRPASYRIGLFISLSAAALLAMLLGIRLAKVADEAENPRVLRKDEWKFKTLIPTPETKTEELVYAAIQPSAPPTPEPELRVEPVASTIPSEEPNFSTNGVRESFHAQDNSKQPDTADADSELIDWSPGTLALDSTPEEPALETQTDETPKWKYVKRSGRSE